MGTDEGPQGGLSAFSRDVVRSALIDVVSRALVVGALALVALIALLVWQGGSLPAWVPVLILALAVVAAYVAYRRVKSLRAEFEEDVGRLEYGLDRHELYSALVAKMLDQLQRVVARDIEVPIPHYIERGVLQPARDLLMKHPAEDVRLSVLMPSGDRWKMIFGAGHSVGGQAKYNERIADTLARLPLETGEIYRWPDVLEDDRFEPNPKATREIRAMISLPLRTGDRRVGVLNVVASLPNVFDQAEFSYVESLASVVSVALGVWLQDQIKGTDTKT